MECFVTLVKTFAIMLLQIKVASLFAGVVDNAKICNYLSIISHNLMQNVDLQALLHEMIGLISKDKAVAQPRQFSGQFQAPIRGNYYNSGNYSPNTATDPRHPNGHKGVDLRAAGGTPIYPIASGVVTGVGSDRKGGNVINIQHTNGIRAYYAHLGSVRVHKGDKVNLNTVIGTVGDSGNAKGTFPHLHIQVWKNNQLIDPGTIFSVPSYTNVNSKIEKVWLSENAKQQARNFNMKSHLGNKTASKLNVEQIAKLCDTYFEDSILL